MSIMKSSYYNLNYRMLLILGQWPYLTKFQKLLRISVIFVCIQSLNIPMCFGLLNALGDLNLMVQCLATLLFVNVCALTCFNSLNRSKKLSILLEKIEKDWVTWSAEPEIEILKMRAEEGKFFRMIYIASMVITTISYFVIPALPSVLNWILPLNESRPLPPIYFTDYKIIDMDKYYYPIFVHNYICTCWFMLVAVNTDTMFMVCTQHACAILAAMGSKLKNLGYDRFSSKGNKTLSKKIDSDITFCAKQHKELIIFLENIHTCFSFLCLMMVVINILLITSTGFQATMNLDNPAEAFRFTVETLAHVIHIFLLTVPGQQLINDSTNLFHSVYKSNWYLLPIHSRKSLLIIMRRSSEPLEIIVGKIYTYSMKNFGVVIKTSISYFTVLISLQ